MMRNWSILTRLTLAFFFVILFATILTTVNLNGAIEQYYLSKMESSLSSNAALIADVLKPYILSVSNRALLQPLAQDLARKSLARVTIIDKDGTVLADSQEDPAAMDNHRYKPEIQSAFAGKIGKATRQDSPTGPATKYVAIPVERDGRLVGAVRLSMPLTEIHRVMGGIRGMLIKMSLISILLSLALAYIIARTFTEPLREMLEAALAVSNGDFGRRLHVTYGGELGRLGSALNDMSRRLEETIRSMTDDKNKVQAILASMVDGVIAVDNESRVMLLNPAACKMFGVSEEMALGRKILEVIRNYELADAFTASTRKQDAGGEVSVKEFRIFSPEEMILRVHVTAIKGENDRAVGAVAVIQDVTELRRLEQVRTEFVGNVSHELRTPLTSIKGFVETLLDGAMDDPQMGRKFLKIIQKETNRLDALISDLLDLSRIESKNFELRKRPARLRKIVESAITTLEFKAKEKNLHIEVLIPQNMEKIPVDRDLLLQVFVNLVDNSIKYTPENGIITISASEDPDWVTVSVSDTGIGIPRQHLSRLFERFYRVDKARSRDVGGTGLGLAIVKHIVERHGGTVSIASEVGRGTSVSFTLPRHNTRNQLLHSLPGSSPGEAPGALAGNAGSSPKAASLT
ncbi:MAG TPA: phosphate regulon sensor histidine kinase PhoR [Firmicutes bacterium]|nr:phosphate regulon sensor histidine kinase PhoR [Bacillota bacterium]